MKLAPAPTVSLVAAWVCSTATSWTLLKRDGETGGNEGPDDMADDARREVAHELHHDRERLEHLTRLGLVRERHEDQRGEASPNRGRPRCRRTRPST